MCCFDGLLSLEEDMGALRDRLVDALHDAVGTCKDRRLRGKLLRLKRDVHNLRRARVVDVEAVADVLPDSESQRLASYFELGQRHAGLQQELAAHFAQELAAARRTFQTLVKDEDFRKGLLLSSEALFAGLERYVAASPAKLGAKGRQLERGLMRYFSRMVMKTSPFATFTGLVEGGLAEEDVEDGNGLDLLGSLEKRSLVRLNKSIYGVLQREVLSNATIRDALPVQLNPTLQRHDDHWHFLSGQGGRETFQRVPCNPVLELYKDILEAPGNLSRSLSLGQARQQVGALVEAPPEQLATFTETLLEIGFLRFRFGIGEQEVDWDRPLARLLDGVDDAEARSVRRFLTVLRDLGERYGAAGVEERRSLLGQATRRIARSYDSLRARRQLRADVPFYEDAGAAARLQVAPRAMAGLEETLVDYIRLTSRLAWPRHDHASMRHFFDGYYSSSDAVMGPSVPLLKFYEDYYREHLKEHLKRQDEMLRGGPTTVPGDGTDSPEKTAAFDELNPFQLPVIDAIRTANDGLTATLRRRWAEDPTAEELVLERHELAAAVASLPESQDPCLSVSVFVQMLPGAARDGGPALLISNYLKGFGKYFSRFLGVLPPSLQARIQDNNRHLSDAYLAEISGNSNFNANLHPPLVDHEVAYPTGESDGHAQPLWTTDLLVEPSTRDPHALVLRHGPSGRQVLPLDLGFQNPRMRPPLYQLLSSLAPACNFFMQVPDNLFTLDEVVAKDPDAEYPIPPVAYRPRMVYDGRLVVARRRWAVRADVFPRRGERETDLEYFSRLQRWRLEHGLPDEVFLSVRVVPVPKAKGSESVSETKAHERQRDRLHKPQYIDFRNPLLVDLFGRATENLESFQVFLYERLPGREHLARHGEQHYVTESVLQVDFPQPVLREVIR